MVTRRIFRDIYIVYLVSFLSIITYAGLLSAMPQGFHLTQDMAVAILVCLCLSLAGLWFARRSQVRLAVAAFTAANICCLAPFTKIAHLAPAYLGRDLPLIDDLLMKADRALGFDWVGYFQWHAAHPLFGQICRVAYLIWPPLALALAGVLVLEGDHRRLARYLIATTMSLVAVYLVAIFTPSYGAYVQHGMSPAAHVGFFVQFSDYKPAYDALRRGIVDIYAAEIPSGAISFPSFHTTTVVLYVWAAWRTRVRWIVCAIELLCLLAIPVQGAHFVTDMIAGWAIGVMMIYLTGLMLSSFAKVRFDAAWPALRPLRWIGGAPGIWAAARRPDLGAAPPSGGAIPVAGQSPAA